MKSHLDRPAEDESDVVAPGTLRGGRFTTLLR